MANADVEHPQVVSLGVPSRPIYHPDGSVQYADGAIDHPDGTVELSGSIFNIDWNELDPPAGSLDAEEIPHDMVMAEMCRLLGLSQGSL